MFLRSTYRIPGQGFDDTTRFNGGKSVTAAQNGVAFSETQVFYPDVENDIHITLAKLCKFPDNLFCFEIRVPQNQQ
ncbi:hypothetical protein ACRWDO_21515 [Escherichia coli]